jgi:hypothetical protein
MEVHHHLRHKGKPRKISEYLFEFLVLFVAITGSFFAENLREHIIETKQEKEYVKSLLQDLTADSLIINYSIMRNKEQIAGLDSLLLLMEKDMSGNEIRQFYYYNLKYAVNYNGYNPTMRTMSQLMNTGGLRLITKKSVSDGIILYDNAIKLLDKQGDLLETRYSEMIDQQSNTIDLPAVIKLRKKAQAKKVQAGKFENFPAKLLINPKKTQVFYFNLTIFKGTIYGYNQRLEALNQQSIRLKELLRREYRI